jgi:two-component system OmpR family sensor kinase
MTASVYSIRKRLLLTLGTAISLATLVQAAISYRIAISDVNDISDYHMVQLAHAMRGHLSERVNPSPGRPVAGEDRSFLLQIMPLPPEQRGASVDNALQSSLGEAPGFSTRQVGKKTFRVFTLHTQTMALEVMHDMGKRSVMAREIALRTILPILVLGPVLLLIVWWGISHALCPLVASREEIARRNISDLHALRTEGAPEELLPFIREINGLFGRIGEAFAAQRSFVADAAHELRTPLTALRLQVQALQRATTATMRDNAIERLLLGIDRATHLIEQMLSLAREEASDSAGAHADLPQVVCLALSDVLPQAQMRNIDIGADFFDHAPAEPFLVRGGAEALRVLLRNLFENAVKYTPHLGVVNLSLRRDGASVVLTIEDSGPGIPQEDRVAVFERFRRGSEHDVEGSGLGLSIVQAIARKNDIRILMDRSTALGGLSVSLCFHAVRASLALAQAAA